MATSFTDRVFIRSKFPRQFGSLVNPVRSQAIVAGNSRHTVLKSPDHTACSVLKQNDVRYTPTEPPLGSAADQRFDFAHRAPAVGFSILPF
jgi:hypothetical protein